MDVSETVRERRVSGMTPGKAQVQAWWDTYPCGTLGVTHPEGSPEFFESIEERRYRLEPFIHEHAEFPRWGGKRVLEVGCGVGTDLLQFARATATAFGTDLTRRAVELSRRQMALYGVAATVVQSDAEDLPFRDGQFDLVYAWGVLHHTPNPHHAIEEIRRVLRAGGTSLVMVYHKRSLVVLQLYLRHGLFKGRPFRHPDDIVSARMESPGTKAYTVAQARALFRQFSHVTVTPVLTPYDTTVRLFPLLGRIIPRRWGWFLVVRAIK